MLKQHPKGLIYIFFTEMWERVGFYTLLAILVLYMDKVLGWSDSKKGDVYGLFLALCYFIPLLGGWLGDRWLGRRNTVKIGAALMTLGYVGLAVSSAAQLGTFYFGLFLIGVGTGIFKVNMAVLVGNLYRDKPHQKDAAFNIFYMGVNLGAMIAPLIATYISIVYGSYTLSFWVCAVGLVLALAVFQAGSRHIQPADYRASSGQSDNSKPGVIPGIDAREEGARIAVLVILFFSVIFFWVAYYQNAFALTLFAERSTRSYTWLRPETYQFFDPAFILMLTPILLALFGRLNRQGKEPSTPVKIFLGMLIMSASMLLMVYASIRGGNADDASLSPAWLIVTYFIITIAEILISPMGQSFVSKVAPPRLAGLMMGGWFAATAAGSYGSGFLGKYYGRFAHHEYFLLLTGLLGISAVFVLLFLRKLKRFSE